MSNSLSFEQWRPHPWHGLSTGPDVPRLVHAYIEITPFDTIKYEIDKPTGYLRVDRPQRSSSLPPALYGFIPRTYCGQKVAELTPIAQDGDHDPLDICVLSERPINRAEILLNARVLGGLRQIDRGEADDKIIAVLEGDNLWGTAKDLQDIPERLIERLAHYFSTYKLVPGQSSPVIVQEIYGSEHAQKVILASLEDYHDLFGGRQ